VAWLIKTGFWIGHCISWVRRLQVLITVYSGALANFLLQSIYRYSYFTFTAYSSLHTHWVLCYQLQTADVPLPGFPNCPHPTATVISDSQFSLHLLKLPLLVPICIVWRFPNNWLLLNVKVKVTLRLTVSQYVLMSSPFWFPWPYVCNCWRLLLCICGAWPDIIFCLAVAVLFLWGALSDERPGLSPVSHCQHYLDHCQNAI
jgi:hypothetical protein